MKGIGSKIRFASAIMKAKLLGEYRPFQVQLSVTDNCNLRCTYCYANYPERGHKNIGTEQVFRIIDELAELGTIRINLVGGEPLLRKDIGEIIDHIKGRGIACAMTSNGYLVRAKIDDVRKLDMLCVSLDGDKEANDANRGEGSYDMAMEAIHLARENNIPLQVATVITKNNLNSMEYLLEMGKELDFPVGFSTMISKTVDHKKDVPPDMPTDQEYRQAIKKILEFKKRGYPVLFSRKTLEYTLNWRYGYERDKIMGQRPDFGFIKCNAGRFFCIIDVNGDIYPCPSLVDVIEPMNCLEHGVKKSFEHINRHECRTCHIPCQNEFNLMYSFDPGVIFNIIKNYRSGLQ